MRYAQLAARVFNTPLMIDPAKAEAIMGVLAPRLGVVELHRGPDVLTADTLAGQAHAARLSPRRPDKLYVVRDGVAVIPVTGTLTHNLRSLDAHSGMTGYDGLAVKLHEALADAEVRAIAFDIDSPGGEVSGAFDFADEIHAARGAKPLVAIVDEFAASAAYLLASACDQIVVPRTGNVGSIGVISQHVEFSQLLQNEGIRVTLIFAGARKADFNSFEPLGEPARASAQAEVNRIHDLFVATVARNRGLTEAAVRSTEAALFGGPLAVDAGLADAVASPQAALAALIDEVSGGTVAALPAGGISATSSQPKPKETSMSVADRLRAQSEEEEGRAEGAPASAEEQEPEAEDESDDPKAEDEQPEAEDEEPKAEDEPDEGASAKAERERIRGIMTAKEAKGRDVLARHLAFDTSTSVKQARSILAAAPQGSVRGDLASAMDKVGNPNIGPGGDGGESDTDVDAFAQRIAALANGR